MATYTLKAGDTLYRLARNHGISLDKLLQLNPGLDPNNYDVGEIITLSASDRTTQSAHPPASGGASTETYTIKAGETLYRIATAHRLSVDQLLKMNPGLDANNYAAGQTINLSSSTYQKPTRTKPKVHRRGGKKAPWFDIAMREMERGVKEISGSVHNRRIVGYHQATTNRATTDEIPWCSSFVNWCVQQAGIKGTQNALANSWLNWGRKLRSPQRGCIVVVKTSSNHVAFYDGEEGNRIRLLGGNQRDQVKISSYSKSSVRAYRWPT